MNLFNETRHDHVLTMEDPVEFVHPFKNCLVNQREVGKDTQSFARALRAALREDPDVIVIGELRDNESVSLALTAAETGHIVLGTLNSTSAPKAVDRILSSFPADEQGQVRAALTESLKFVIAQRLLPAKEARKQVAAFEVLRNTVAVANMIREEKTYQIPSAMQIGRSLGMQTFDDALKGLLAAARITGEAAYRAAVQEGGLRGVPARRRPGREEGVSAEVPVVAPKIDRFLRLMTSRGASDFHLTVGRPPMLRVSGTMEPIRYRTLVEADYVELVRPIVPPRLWEEFVATGDVDLSYEVPGLARFRVNLFRQQRGSGAVFRVIPTKIMTLEQLGMPEPVHRLAAMENGLVLVTGPTGSGKSTTLAAIINLINETRNYHVITIEDPIEFVHPNKKCLVHQREIGTHATSFAEALKAAGREDPDLVLVGEMRDLETISMALAAAEKGTIVFGTLHTNNAAKTVDRIISVFPASEQDGIRNVLGETLRAVVAQQLIPKVGGGRVAAIEILFSSPAIGNMIREGKTPQITSAIQTGSKDGMIDMDSSIRKLYDEKKITARAAIDKAIDKSVFKDLLEEGAAPGAH